MLNWLKSRFGEPKPAGPPRVLRAFASDQPTITQSGIRVENAAWRIDALAEEQTMRLFEVEISAFQHFSISARAKD